MLITVALKSVLKSGTVNIHTLFFFKIILGILSFFVNTYQFYNEFIHCYQGGIYPNCYQGEILIGLH